MRYTLGIIEMGQEEPWVCNLESLDYGATKEHLKIFNNGDIEA